MTQPTPYDRSYSFTDFSSGSPSSQPPGTQLDAEYDAVAQTLDEVLTNLALIQRDDGMLGNGSVQVDQLGSTALALIGSSAFAVRGTWLSGETYVKGDMVSSGGVTYLAMTDHDAGVLSTDVAAGRLVTIFESDQVLSDALAAEAEQVVADVSAALAAGTVSDLVGTRIYSGRAALNADLTPLDGQYALVVGDANLVNNDLYRKVGASAAGSWDGPMGFFASATAGAAIEADAAAASAASAAATKVDVEAIAAPLQAALADAQVEIASDHDVTAAVLVRDNDDLGYRVLTGHSSTSGAVGNGALVEFYANSGNYLLHGQPSATGYSATIKRLIGPLDGDAQGLTGVAGVETAVGTGDVLDPRLSTADLISWTDAATGAGYWQPAAGLPGSQTDPSLKWTSAKRIEAEQRVSFVGDSLTVDMPLTSAAYPSMTAVKDAVSGSTVEEILARAGVTAPLITVTGGTIPGDGSYVALTDLAPFYIMNSTYEGFVNDVPVFLRTTGVTAEVARQTAGAAVTVAAATPFIRDLDDIDDRILVLWMGRNDIEQNPAVAADTIADTVLAGFALAYEAANTLSKQVLFIPPPQSETDTATQKAAVAEIRQRLKDQYGDWYVTGEGSCLDLTAYAFDTGPSGLLQLSGFTPDANDSIDIAAGLWPRQLRSDVVHQKPLVSTQIGKIIYETVIPAKGWF